MKSNRPLTDYRKMLLGHLEHRTAQNPRYSLRAFARDIGVSPSRLSHILKGTFGLSGEAAREIANKLGLSHQESQQFCSLVESKHARSKTTRNLAQKRLSSLRAEFNPLSLDAFFLVSDWYHLALLEFFANKPKTFSQTELAKYFDISEVQVSGALERLCRLDMLKKTATSYRCIGEFYINPAGTPSDAIRSFHKQILERALLSLSRDSVNERDFSNLIFSIDPNDVSKLRKRIETFRLQLDKEFSKYKKQSKIYSLALQLFPLTRKEVL